ncbi:MAG: RNA polymerase sporulation sigma factor SigK [Lachnospiraceae bacterium]|nr:RNA polymerase sporulation sigma factor SigK [Lachnospiraceae bacterium]MDD7147020.1 RNA polymerase sporulation sigma factor SigK [Lachnospiraceae bacterium]MDY4068259.1 RNA polymerase sporulation sigma factor SigK [Lachnospiraceae bacterium]
MKTFQQPLSSEEEAAYIKRLHDENCERAEEARRILIERNLRLVAHIAKKYQNVDEDMEDLISIGTIGLIKAVNTFDSDKTIKLSSYASKCIENELLMMLRGRKKKAREVSLYEPIGMDKEGNEISLLDVIENEQTDVLDRMELKQNVGKLGTLLDARLTDREREIICMRYGLSGDREITQREIGNMLGISRSYVSRIEKRALCKLREGFDQTKYTQ